MERPDHASETDGPPGQGGAGLAGGEAPRRPRRDRRRDRKWWALALAVGLAVCAAAIWGEWDRLHPDPLRAGLAAYDRGDYKAANERAREALRAAKEEPRALRLLARSAARLGRHRTAAPIYWRLGPAAVEAEDDYLMGVGLDLIGKSDQAIESWEQGIKRDPNHPETLAALAPAYAQHRRFDKAAEMAARLARQPGWEARGDLMLGVLRAEMNDPAGAAEALQRSLRRDPKPEGGASNFRRLLGRCLLSLGKPAEAEAQLRAALDAGPDAEASWLLSRARLGEGRPAEASAALEQAGSYRADHPLDPEPAPYVGASKCAECHRAICESERTTRHARSLFRGPELKGLPLPDQPLPDPGDPSIVHTIARDGDRVRAETTIDGKVRRVLVEYAFGTPGRYVTMVGRDELGQARAVRLSHYESARGPGWDLTSGADLHPEKRGDYAGRPVDTLEGAVRCLACHATNVRTGQERTGPETADRGIGCEHCHGPGGNHLAAVAAHWADPAIVNPARGSGEAIMKMCSECHSLDEPLAEATAPRDDPVWLRSQAMTLGWSRCFTESEGALTCLTCHAPHRPARDSAEHYEARCLACHSSPNGKDHSSASTPVGRGAACPVNPAKGCLDCHMPAVENPRMHTTLTDHYIRIRREKAEGR